MTAPMPSSPTLLVVQHHDDCPPALLGSWLAAAGVALDVRRPYGPGPDLPAVAELAAYDGLLVLGGPMGAGDEDSCPWLGPTKALVREAVRLDLPTLGVCLGHQLAGDALGGRVAVNPRGQQLGLTPVGWAPAAADDPLLGRVAARSEARGIHWNDDLLVDLPDGAEVLAATPAGEAQVVRLAPWCWGVQLHPEADLAVVSAWAASDRGSHEARGIDQAALLADLDGARAELDATWAPLAQAFADLLAARATRATRATGSPGQTTGAVPA